MFFKILIIMESLGWRKYEEIFMCLQIYDCKYFFI